ncbi:multiple organellar RNA editing factor 8, chloroplastic/mitochondrial-like [Phragmites australis]|uniref:multiple organellar RNA editing factor 8, chloroplastic/mitochondrial-like n=1 Tax=Phragmites australis TaxID=29695 RepID=UPI002D79F404|nr:multiple organellar RNA editing factor 8, chloroplastic/mitochondrial-like [Phragmites australis]
MATASRALLLSRAALSPLPAAAAYRRLPLLLRPLAAAATLLPAAASHGPAARCYATQPATSSLRDSSPNWTNRPPKETILLDGCDFEHWLVVMEPPPGDAANPEVTRDEIIDSYIKTLAQVVGSEEEARQKIYSVSTRHYFAFGALVSEELSYKLKELPKVRWVLPDSYLDVKNKDYGGEPFINGEAVPYDPKYHEEWVRNNARANERSRRNDRPRSFDRSRNFERRRDNMQNFQNRDAPPGQGFNGPPPPPGQNQMPPREGPPMHHGQGNIPPPPPPPHAAGGPPNYQPQMPNPQAGYTPGGAPPFQQGGAPGYQGGPPGYQGGNQGYQGNPGPAYPGANPGYQGGAPGYQGGNPPPPYQGGNPNAPPYQGGGNPPPPYQGGNPNAAPYHGGGNPGYGGGAPGGYPGGQGGNPNYQ